MSQSTRWQGVLLDLDGTLLHTLPDLAHAANEMRVALNLPPLQEHVIGTFVGKGVDHLVACTLKAGLDNTSIPDESFNDARAIFFQAYHAINGRAAKLYPGVLDGLRLLQDMRLKIGVVTNKPTEFTLPLLERTGLSEFMQAVVCGDTCAKRKPDPDPILYACTLLKTQPHLTLTIGDSINDARAARAAGCPVLAVPYGYNEGMPVTALPVDGIVDSLVDAVHWMKNPPHGSSTVA
jgi:phosphoglycolate phosphatase